MPGSFGGNITRWLVHTECQQWKLHRSPADTAWRFVYWSPDNSLIRRLLIGLLNSVWIFGLGLPSKNSSLAEIRRIAAFFGKEDLPTVKQPLSETFLSEDEQKPSWTVDFYRSVTVTISTIATKISMIQYIFTYQFEFPVNCNFVSWLAHPGGEKALRMFYWDCTFQTQFILNVLYYL